VLNTKRTEKGKEIIVYLFWSMEAYIIKGKSLVFMVHQKKMHCSKEQVRQCTLTMRSDLKQFGIARNERR
jgi:hypothetical protein